jgi:WD40 repeat protein
MSVSPDGRFVAAAGNSGCIKLWRWGAWETPVEITALVGRVKNVVLAFSPGGERLACGGYELGEKATQVRLYSTKDGAPAGSIPLKEFEVMAVAFSHDGKRLAAVGHIFNGRVWDVVSGKLVTEIKRDTLFDG